MTTKRVFSRGSHEVTKPQSLIGFSDHYKKHRKDLILFLKNKKGESVSFFIAHIESHGSWGLKKIEGFVKHIDDQEMVIETKNDYYCDYPTPVELKISFYNLFDRIPLLNENINPFGYAEGNGNSNYFLRLREMKKILKERVGKKHSAKLFFAWDDFHSKFNEGNFFVEGVIHGIDDLGVSIFSNRSCFYKGKQLVVVNEIPSVYFWPFVSPEACLKRIIICEDCLDDEVII